MFRPSYMISRWKWLRMWEVTLRLSLMWVPQEKGIWIIMEYLIGCMKVCVQKPNYYNYCSLVFEIWNQIKVLSISTIGVGDEGDAAASSRKIFGQIWAKFRQIWSNFGQIWAKFGQKWLRFGQNQKEASGEERQPEERRSSSSSSSNIYSWFNKKQII